MNDAEPGPAYATAHAYAHELRELAAFLEEHPAVADGRTLAEAITAAEDAMTALDDLADAEADDFS